MAHRGCARDVLPHGLLSELSPGAGASVANRSGRSARFAVRVVALDLGEGAKTGPPGEQRGTPRSASFNKSSGDQERHAVNIRRAPRSGPPNVAGLLASYAPVLL